MNEVATASKDVWKKVRLAELVSVSGSQVKPWLTPDEIFTYISLEDIEAGTGRILNLQPTPGREIASAKTRFRRGDILYGRLRPYLQKIVIAPSDGVAATELLVLRPQELVDPEFLQEVLLGTEHKEQVTQLMSGARMPRVRAAQLLDLAVMLPPQKAQHGIARALSVLRQQTEAMQGRLAEAAELAMRFDRQLLGAAFDGRLSAAIREGAEHVVGADLLKDIAGERRKAWEDAKTRIGAGVGRGLSGKYPKALAPDVPNQSPKLPTSWAWASLSEISSAVDPICYGIVQPGDDVGSGVPLVRVQDLEEGSINPRRLRRVSEDIDRQYARSRLKGGEVLVSLVGTVGQIAQVPPDLIGANIARAIAKVTPSQPDLEEWVALALCSPALQTWLMGSARGVARNTLNLSKLAHAPIPLAPPAERTWILEQLRRRRRTLVSLQVKLEETGLAVNAVWAIMRTRALNGTATLSNPTDEAVEAARATRTPKEEITAAGGRKVRGVTVIKQKLGDPSTRRDLKAVLDEHPDGLEPMRLLEEAGYGLYDVEAFFKALAEDTMEGRVKETRTDEDWPILVAT